MPVIVVSFASVLGLISLYTRSLLTSGWGDGMSRRESKCLGWRHVQTDRHTTQVDQDPRHTETQTERQTETHRHQMPADPDTHKHTEIHTHTPPPPSVLTSFSQHLTHDNTDEDGGREPPSKKEIKIAPDTRKKRKKK